MAVNLLADAISLKHNYILIILNIEQWKMSYLVSRQCRVWT